MEESHQTSAVESEPLSGQHIFVRRLAASDRDGYAALFTRLSPESRYRRFLGPKLRLSDEELTYFTEIDHGRHEALAAVDGDDGSIVGVARYVRYRDRPGVAEMAFEVADDLQRRGIGLMLSTALVQLARENGVGVLVATTLWQNRAARALMRRLGFRARASDGAGIELELRLSERPGT